MPIYFIAEEVGINKNSVVDWSNFLRDICVDWNQNNVSRIGGIEEEDGAITPHVVEIDETVVRRRKYNLGRRKTQQWMFGGIDRSTKNVFLSLVPNRRADTLLPILEQHVQPGTHIISDCYSSYNGISTLGNGIYSHGTVNHSLNL
jgi:hypothetical protein